MDENPWAVNSIKDFWFLNCPECDFKAKEENCFLHHANEEHSLSWILLQKSVEIDPLRNSTMKKASCIKFNGSTIKNEPMEDFDIKASELEQDSSNLFVKEEVSRFEDIGSLEFQSNKFLISSVSNNKRTQNERTQNIKDTTLNKSKEKNNSNFVRNGMKKPSKRPIVKKAGYSSDRKKLRDNKSTKIKSLSNIVNCDICCISFSHKSKLTIHVNEVHLKLKPNLCSNCGASFSRPWVLREHIKRVHENIRPFKCERCENAFFPDQSTLTRHVEIVHEKKKPYQCHQCSNTFPTKQNMQNHITSVHERDKSLECSFCHAKFALKKYLAVHVKKFHAEKE